MSNDDLKRHVLSIIQRLENPPFMNGNDEEVDELNNYVQTEFGEWIKDPVAVLALMPDGETPIDETCSLIPDGYRYEDQDYVDYWFTADNHLILGGTIDDSVYPMTGYQYLSDALDVQFIVNRKREYLGARILVTFGGPNIWINTLINQVEGYWWSDSYVEGFHDVMNLDEACEEIWNAH